MLGARTAYFLCMVAATIVAALLLRRRQQRLAIGSVQKLGIAIGGLIGATFAAKLPFILSADPHAGVLAAWLSDGKTILWGLAGGYIGVEIAKWAFHVKASTGDTAGNSYLQPFQGNWMPIYLIVYAAYRFVSEFWRPEEHIAIGLTFYQWSSIVIAISFVALLVARCRSSIKCRSKVRSS